MSAKDPRRSMVIHIPAEVGKHLRLERRCGRSNSAAAAIRRIVERELRSGYADCGCPPADQGTGYRLQLGRGSRHDVADLSQRHGVAELYILTQLLANAAARDAPIQDVPNQDVHNQDMREPIC